MTLYAYYTRREFDAQEEAETLGLTCHVPRRVDLIRQGKRRRPDPVIRPYLPGYVFVETDADGWHMLKASKHLRTWMGIGPKEAERVMQFIARVEADFTQRMRQIEAGERVSEYAENDLLEILDGGFKEKLLKFSRVAEGANGLPLIVAKTEMFGREVEIPLDPLIVKKAANA
jgi:transcription antitermination factor NusG